MRKGLLWMLLVVMIFMLTGCNKKEVDTVTNAGVEADVWMLAVTAGKADALLVSVDGHTCLVDTGYAHVRGRILAAMDAMGVEKLDAVFVTHTDDDHVEGLEWLAASDIEVGAWYASAMYIDVKESKHPAVEAAAMREEEVIWLKAGDSVSLGSGTMEVLAPGELNKDKDDNNSLVMMLRTAEGNILLAGDMEYTEEEWVLNSGADLDCDVLKVANHADDDTGSQEFLRAASPKVAVISTDTIEKPSTPDRQHLLRLQLAGAKVYETQDATGGVLVRLDDGKVNAEYFSLPQFKTEVQIISVVPGEDTITLRNNGDEMQNLDDWYLFSDRGKELFVLPDGTELAPGAQLTIGTNTTTTTVDLLWNDKEVIHKSKDDIITLYNQNGSVISVMSNR